MIYIYTLKEVGIFKTLNISSTQKGSLFVR